MKDIYICDGCQEKFGTLEEAQLHKCQNPEAQLHKCQNPIGLDKRLSKVEELLSKLYEMLDVYLDNKEDGK